ncbi:MAG TPA: general stress protein [Anaerolineaceae bacterium]|nr:general stress protein [Anaerolineaceae bacterium]
MTKTVVGLYDNFEQAQEVIRDLVKHGIARENISLIANDAQSRYSRELGVNVEDSESVGESAAKGAGVGAALGGITGLLVGIGTFALPGIGPIIGAGPLAAALGTAGVGAAAGAATGGMIGALTESGVPETDANIFTEGVRRGGALVMAYVSDDLAERAADVMNHHNPVDLESRSAQYRQENWKGFNEEPEPFAFDRTHQTFREREPSSTLDFGPGADNLIAGQPVSDYDRRQADLGNYQNSPYGSDLVMFEPRFRQHFDTKYGRVSGRWEDFRELYRYGFEKGRDERYANGDWEMVRDDLRSDWEQRNPGQNWDTVESAIYEGWRTGRVQS